VPSACQSEFWPLLLRAARKNTWLPAKLGVTLVFEDERCLAGLDRVDESGEQRWHALGAVQIEPGSPFVLLVVHVYREDHHGEEIIRIPERAAIGISARKAEKHDIRRYQKQTLD